MNQNDRAVARRGRYSLVVDLAQDEAVVTLLRHLRILLGEVYKDHASEALDRCPCMKWTVRRKVAPESLLNDGLEEVCRQARDHQGIRTLWRDGARHCQGRRTRRRAWRRGNQDSQVVRHGFKYVVNR